MSQRINVTEEIRETIKQSLRRRKISTAQAAEQLGISRVYLNSLLNGKLRRSKYWQAISELAGYTIETRVRQLNPDD